MTSDQPPTARFCPTCGTPSAGGRFCASCGTSLAVSTSQVTDAVTPPADAPSSVPSSGVSRWSRLQPTGTVAMRTRTRQVAALLVVVAVLDVALAYLAMNVGRILNNVSQVLTANGSNLVAPADYTVQMVAAIIVAVAALAMAGALVRRPTQFRLSLAIAVAGAQPYSACTSSLRPGRPSWPS